MTAISRRGLLAATAAMMAMPARAQSLPREVDVAIVGAGAAGIAAARRLVAARRSVVVVEAANRIGGRCHTDVATFGTPFDRGAHWLFAPDTNPLMRLAQPAGIDVYRAPQGQRIRIGRRYAREGETEDYFATLVRAQRALADAPRTAIDNAGRALPADLGEWKPLVQFVLGPLAAGRDLVELSAGDLARAGERHTAAFARQGIGTLIEKLAAGLPVVTGAPVSRVTWNGPGVQLDMPQGSLRARMAIITVPGPIVTEGALRFAPDLPRRHVEAFARLAPGSFDHIAVALNGNPLGLQADEVLLEKATSHRTASLLANVSGSALSLVGVGGKFGHDLSAQGAEAMAAFATDWLAELFGADIRKSIRRTTATRWNADPLARGAWSASFPDGAASRRVLAERVGDRLWFAGDAVHETQWGTVHGAWESGDRAASEILARLSPPPAAPPERRPARRQT